jgi:hypothetical protein
MQAELEDDRGYLVKFDRSVFAIHYHLAKRLGKQKELLPRYQFHIQLLKLLRALQDEQARMESVFLFLSSREQLAWKELDQVVEVWRPARQALAAVLRQASDLYPPPLKHLNVGESLGHFLPAQPSIPDLDPVQTALNLPWGEQLHRELVAVLDKLNGIQIKSLGAILVIQEQLAREWDHVAAVSPVMESS